MEPKQSGQPGGIEHVPAPASVFEGLSPGVEQMGGLSHERKIENHPEVGAVQAEAAQIAMPTLPAPVAQQDDTTVTNATDDSIPAVAADDDLIEKEWVDKAKKILAETKDDPHRREAEVSKLQIEYIRKRYGRQIGDAGDQ
ncbi:hypothetical protein IPM09_03895 [Candidatus Saccharibacteria bacterium]|nr:MAG: hypothetical protein IPM09_03895 [Candidatus Saccharibacteria bacterium]